MIAAAAFSIDRPSSKVALLIEDDPVLREVLACSLKEAGYYPLAFTTAREVLTMLGSLMVEIIIIDLLLPGMDGVAFVRELERRELRNAPILVISALEEGLRRTQEIQAEGYLAKPFSCAELIRLADVLVENHAALQRYEALL